MNSPATTPARYESYLLRLRWMPEEDHPTCQAMLQSVSTKERHYFSDLQSLFSFLDTHLSGEGDYEIGHALNT